MDIAIIHNSRGLEGHRAACNRIGALTAVRVSEDKVGLTHMIKVKGSKATLS